MLVEKMGSVLIVDDEIGARESLKMILKNDYEVFLAKIAEEAFSQIKEHSPMDKSLVEKPDDGNWVSKKFVYIPGAISLSFWVISFAFSALIVFPAIFLSVALYFAYGGGFAFQALFLWKRGYGEVDDLLQTIRS
jgi:CheY-like chemotaxis protein